MTAIVTTVTLELRLDLIETTLNAFLNSGRLGAIRLGMTTAEIHRLLGSPDAFSRYRAGRQIWKYGCWQLAFDENILDFIGIYFRLGEGLPDKLRVLGYFPARHTSRVEFTQYLRREAISFAVDPRLTFATQECLVTAPGVRVIFDTQAHELDSI